MIGVNRNVSARWYCVEYETSGRRLGTLLPNVISGHRSIIEAFHNLENPVQDVAKFRTQADDFSGEGLTNERHIVQSELANRVLAAYRLAVQASAQPSLRSLTHSTIRNVIDDFRIGIYNWVSPRDTASLRLNWRKGENT